MTDRVYHPYLVAKGGIAALQAGGSHFASHQGEYWQMSGSNWNSDNRRYAHGEAQMFIIELEDGQWLADHTAYQDEPKFSTREDALRAAAASVIERVTWACRDWDTMSEEQANHIARWAARIAKLPTPERIRKPPRKGQIEMFPR
jgi:hypothetical protein